MAAEQKRPPTAAEAFNMMADSYEDSTAGCTYQVATEIVRLLPPVTSASVVLDNAAGTGLATKALLSSIAEDTRPTIHCADASENMIAILSRRFAASSNIDGIVTPGEDLSTFADNTFTHSMTIMGILFFTDAVKGAQELYRTLQPGGVAAVTSWIGMGHMAPIYALQRAIRPNDEPFSLPLDKKWLDPEVLRNTLAEGGFGEDVEISEITVYWSAADMDELVSLATKILAQRILKELTEEERERASAVFPDIVRSAAEECTRVDGTKGVGFPMRASIAICKKK